MPTSAAIQGDYVAVPDLKAAVAKYVKLGYQEVQFTTWGTLGKPGSGEHSYMDTDKVGGISAELYHAN